MGIFSTAECSTCVTLALQQATHCLLHSLTSVASPGLTNLLLTRCVVARTPGCTNLWMVSNTCCLKSLGTTGRHTPMETSHHTGNPSTWTAIR